MRLINNQLKNNNAFVMLYALLVASIVLSIGLSLSAIISKQIQLSSMGKMSKLAYFAADAGRNCGYVWGETAYNILSGVRDSSGIIGASAIFDCYDIGGTSITESSTPLSSGTSNLISMLNLNPAPIVTDAKEFAFERNFTDSCAKISVIVFPLASPSNYKSIIISRGFSSICSNITLGRTVSQMVVSKTLYSP